MSRLVLGAFGLALLLADAGATVETRTTESGLPSNRVTALAADPEGWLWVGTAAGLARFDGERFRPWPTADGRRLEVRALVLDRGGRLWVGSAGDGLWQRAGGILEPAPRGGTLEGETVTALAATPDGALWAATDRGLARIAPGRSAERIAPESGPHPTCTALAVAPDGAPWCAGPDGVFRVTGESLRRVDEQPAMALAFPRGRPVAAGDERAIALDDGTVRIEARAADPGAVLARVLLAEADGALWLGGERLARLPADGGVPAIDPEWPRRVLTLAADGAGGVWAGTDGDGLVRIAPPVPVDLPAPPPPAVSVEGIVADERVLDPGRPVPPGTGRLAIAFAAGGALGAGPVEVRHRLIGRDAEWQRAGDRREAVWAALPAGDYRFEVSARRGGGAWGPVAAVDFAVAPRWHERSTVRLAAVATLLAALYAAHRLRLAGLARRQRELEAEVAARTAELARFNRELSERVGEQTVEIRETRDQAILTLARLAELRDGTTGEHLDRIALFSRRLTEALADGPFGPLGADFVEEIFRSSPLHDIGKVAIPDAILSKPGPLDAAERAVMERHTTIGGDTLRGVVERSPIHSFLEMGMAIAYAHHERWDGAGYPRRLAGEAIPLAARIVALADAYDAITASRPYKPGHGHDEAVRRILADADRHFDGRVVDAFRRIHAELDRIRREHAAATG